MKIVAIFAVVEQSLYSVLYDDYVDGKETNLHELKRLINNWNDPEYLEDFFTSHDKDLQSGFYGGITVDEAVDRTIAEANALNDLLIGIAEAGKTDKLDTLSTLFKPLNKGVTKTKELEKNKVYGTKRNSWLRIYAIRIAPNVFVISGGAIKLTQTMEEREHLKEELEKLEITKQYLKDNNLLDESDFDFLEFIPE